MSQGEHHAQIQQWRELEQAEAEARRIEDANLALQGISASQDDKFRRELESKYPQIMAVWPGRNK